MTQTPEFRPIPDFPDYGISKEGIVISFERTTTYKNGIEREYSTNKMATRITRGYKIVDLRKGSKRYTRYIHRLLAEVFLDSWDPELTVDHINSNKLDNSLDNLQMLSMEENTKKWHREQKTLKLC